MASFTSASPQSGTFIEPTIVDLTVFTDSTETIEDTAANIFWQRYAQSEEGVFDVTARSNIAGIEGDCIHVRFFDPNGVQTPLYQAPSECEAIVVPLEETDTALQAAYTRGDFSIAINGLDVVNDLGFTIRGLFKDNGDPIPFTDFQPGNIYVSAELGMFVFFHFPDEWDSGCSYWDLAWWDNGGLSESTLDDYPYVSVWDDEDIEWDDIDDPVPLNTYWDTVSEAPAIDATVVCAYWTQDNADPLEPHANGPDAGDPADITNADNRSMLFTSPITISALTQLRFRSVNALNELEDTRAETYTVGLRLELNKGVNLISEPRLVSGVEAELENIFTGVDLLQVYRIENGSWEVFTPSTSAVLNDFEVIDNTHGFFVIMNGADVFCLPYGTLPTTTELTLVDDETNQGINAIGVPRKSIEDNTIDNLLVSRGVQFDEIFRVTDGVFETYIPTRPDILNFDPAELEPGRGYGVVTQLTQTFELPLID